MLAALTEGQAKHLCLNSYSLFTSNCLPEILNRFSFGETQVIGADIQAKASQNQATNIAHSLRWGRSEIIWTSEKCSGDGYGRELYSVSAKSVFFNSDTNQ